MKLNSIIVTVMVVAVFALIGLLSYQGYAYFAKREAVSFEVSKTSTDRRKSGKSWRTYYLIQTTKGEDFRMDGEGFMNKEPKVWQNMDKGTKWNCEARGKRNSRVQAEPVLVDCKKS